LPVCLELLVDLVCAVAGLSGEPIDLLASVGGEDLGIFADLCAFAGDVLLANVLDLGCVGCERSVSVMSSSWSSKWKVGLAYLRISSLRL
jgi:hypothetical protein